MERSPSREAMENIFPDAKGAGMEVNTPIQLLSMLSIRATLFLSGLLFSIQTENTPSDAIMGNTLPDAKTAIAAPYHATSPSSTRPTQTSPMPNGTLSIQTYLGLEMPEFKQIPGSSDSAQPVEASLQRQ